MNDQTLPKSLRARKSHYHFGMIVYFYEAECHVEKLVCYLQGQSYIEGLHNNNLTVSTVSSKFLIL